MGTRRDSDHEWPNPRGSSQRDAPFLGYFQHPHSIPGPPSRAHRINSMCCLSELALPNSITEVDSAAQSYIETALRMKYTVCLKV